MFVSLQLNNFLMSWIFKSCYFYHRAKYSAIYSGTIIEEKFPILMKVISKMLSKKPEERLSCRELLAKTHEWTVDTIIIRSDVNYKEFIEISENNDKLEIFENLM